MLRLFYVFFGKRDYDRAYWQFGLSFIYTCLIYQITTNTSHWNQFSYCWFYHYEYHMYRYNLISWNFTLFKLSVRWEVLPNISTAWYMPQYGSKETRIILAYSTQCKQKILLSSTWLFFATRCLCLFSQHFIWKVLLITKENTCGTV